MFKWWARRKTTKRRTAFLYQAIMAQARQNVFFTDYAISDDFQGRFSVLCAHIFLVMQSLKRHGPEGEKISQALADHTIKELDYSLREVGVGDMAVPKRMRAMAQVLYHALGDYQASIEYANPEHSNPQHSSPEHSHSMQEAGEIDIDKLKAALKSNIYQNSIRPGELDHIDTYADKMAHYMKEMNNALAQLTLEDFNAERFHFKHSAAPF